MDKRLLWLVMAGLMICALLNTGCAYKEDEARRELIVVGGEETIYAFNPREGTLFELGEDEAKTSWYRELKWEPPADVKYYPLGQMFDQSINLYGTSPEGTLEIQVVIGETEISVETHKLGIDESDAPIAINGDDILLANNSDLTIVENGVESVINKPEGDFSQSVATRNQTGEWVGVWPDMIEEKPAERGRSWSKLSLGQPGKVGAFTVQVISNGSVVDEYRLENETYKITRAKGLIGVLTDPDGRLLILDDKGYISVFDGEKLIKHFPTGVTPSQYAMDSMSWGPEGRLLVTDAVGRIVNMYDPETGENLYSWRLPRKEKEYTARAGIFPCIVDAILLILVIILIIRIMTRVKRHQVYREGGDR